VVVKSAAELAGGDFTMVDLVDCTVFLLGRLSALRLRRLKRCRVYGGPVVGATFAEGAQIWRPPDAMELSVCLRWCNAGLNCRQLDGSLDGRISAEAGRWMHAAHAQCQCADPCVTCAVSVFILYDVRGAVAFQTWRTAR
jgi:hypothetical protein